MKTKGKWPSHLSGLDGKEGKMSEKKLWTEARATAERRTGRANRWVDDILLISRAK